MSNEQKIIDVSRYVRPEIALKAIRRVLEEDMGMGWDEFVGIDRKARQVELRTTAIEAFFRMSSDPAHHLTEEAAAEMLGMTRGRVHYHRERYASFASIYKGYTFGVDSMEAAARDYVELWTESR